MAFFRKGLRAALALTVVLTAALSCALPARAGEILVSAAASLSDAFTEIRTAFEATHPGTTVRTNFAASGPLLKQMQTGAPVDVFASADEVTMNRAVADKLVDPATRATFAINKLVLIVPAGSSLKIAGAADLAQEGVKQIAVGNPESVPAGRYAQQALTAAGLWERLQPRFVLAASVRQVLDYVRRGEVEAGFVYRSDALKGGKDVRVVAIMSGHTPVTYPIAVGATGTNAAEALNFVNFVRSPAGQSILVRHGFGKQQ